MNEYLVQARTYDGQWILIDTRHSEEAAIQAAEERSSQNKACRFRVAKRKPVKYETLWTSDKEK